jgi:hypothetical protein
MFTPKTFFVSLSLRVNVPFGKYSIGDGNEDVASGSFTAGVLVELFNAGLAIGSAKKSM